MGLFSKKKEQDDELPPLQFPELSRTVPSFEPDGGLQERDAQDIKAVVAPSFPTPFQSRSKLPESLPTVEQPLFVRIEKYRDVVDTLKKLKARLNDAEGLLNKLHELKQQEEHELELWQADLERIRDQLLDIDKKLFE